MLTILIPTQPTITEITVALRESGCGERNLERVASENGRKIAIRTDLDGSFIGLECEYDYAIRDSRSHFAPVSGLLIEARGGPDVIRVFEAISGSFGGYVLDVSGDKPKWTEVTKSNTISPTSLENSRITLEKFLTNEESVRLADMLTDTARLASILPLISEYSASVHPLTSISVLEYRHG